MFTGLVEERGTVVGVVGLDEARRFSIRAPRVAGDLREGGSVAVDGACQTVVEVDGDVFSVVAVAATLGKTTLGSFEPGRSVNLERPLVLGGRLDGHLVQGHVDGVGRLERRSVVGEQVELEFTVPAAVRPALLIHGSITINGVSLTIQGLDPPDRVRVAIIPHTAERTNLGTLAPGATVNVEGDLIGKYVGSMLASVRSDPGPVPAGSPDQPPASGS